MTTAETPRGSGSDSGGDGSGGEDVLGDVEDLDLPGMDHPGDDGLDVGEIFELLQNERRRWIIAFLKDHEDQATSLDVLAEYIAALENDVDVAQLSSSQRKRVYIALYQCHLPKLDDFGVVDFDKDRGTVELRDTAVLDPYLADHETGSEGADPTKLGVAVVVAATVAIGLTGVGVLSAVPVAFWTLLSVVALLWAAGT